MRFTRRLPIPEFSMPFTLSAFADEIGPDPQQQVDVLLSCGIRHIEFRAIRVGDLGSDHPPPLGSSAK